MAQTYEQLKKLGYTDFKIKSILDSQKAPAVTKPASGGTSNLYTKQSVTGGSTAIKPTSGTFGTAPKPADASDSDWQKYQTRLSGTNPVTGTPVSGIQQNIIDSQKAQQSGQMSYEQATQKRKERMYQSLSLSPTVAPEYLELFKNKWNAETGKMEGVTPQEWASIPDRFKRDEDAERGVLDKYGSPDDREDMADYYEIAYGKDRLAGLIETGQIAAEIFSPQKLAELGLTPERLQGLVDAGYLRPEFLENMAGMAAEGMQAAGVLGATPKPTNEMMNILGEALNAKNEYKKQELGTSDLFKMAGLSGYEVLAQSLGQRASEMDQRYKSAATLVAESGGAMASQYKQIADHYNRIREDYVGQMDRIMAIDKEARDYEFAMEKMEAQMQNQKDLEQFKYDLKEKEREAEEKLWKDISESGEGANVGGVNVNPEQAKTFLGKVFNVGSIGDWCGVFASKISDAGSVGNSWAEKRQRITHQDNPTIGDKLLIPIGVKTDKGNGAGEYGHVAVVLGYDKETGIVTVVESNRDGRQNNNPNNKGVISVGTYNMNDMKKQYREDWGFMKGNLRSSYLNPLIESLPSGIAKGAVQMATGDAQGGMVNLIRGSAETVENLIEAIKPNQKSTSELTPVKRYEAATGKKITESTMNTLKKEAKAGTLENYLGNLESKAAEAKAKKDETALKAKEKEQGWGREEVEAAERGIEQGRTPDEVYKELAGASSDEQAKAIMEAAGYKLEKQVVPAYGLSHIPGQSLDERKAPTKWVKK